jgi:phage terminase large subunit-like protein
MFPEGGPVPADDDGCAPLIPWSERAHEGQLEPEGDHSTWLILAGRGFGKTRAGAEWIAEKVRTGGKQRIALVAATIKEARQVMIEGDSGLLAVAEDLIHKWHPSRGEIHFYNGSIARIFSGNSPAKLRGFQFHHAWCDELAKWTRAVDSWDNLQMALRLGEDPRVVVTTTPAACPLLEQIIASRFTVITRGTTFDNPHLGQSFKERMEELYGSTRKGAVELYGEMPGPAGALWTPELIADSRSEGEGLPDFDGLAIGVDPPSGDGVCGIVACGRDKEGRFHVIADHQAVEAGEEHAAAPAADVSYARWS